MLGRGDIRSIFTETIFTRRVFLSSSLFIKAMHPKTEIRPDPESMRKVLENGWIGQLKIRGHRAQIHIPSDPKKKPIAYTRQGRRHTVTLPAAMVKEIDRLFRPEKDWNVIDAEWLKKADKLFVFDFLKSEGTLLSAKTFPERHALLPRHFISPHVSVLPLLRDLSACQGAIATPKAHIEGLVFKSSTSIGFSDTSIVRCRLRTK